jgi:hypothetical protein
VIRGLLADPPGWAGGCPPPVDCVGFWGGVAAEVTTVDGTAQRSAAVGLVCHAAGAGSPGDRDAQTMSPTLATTSTASAATSGTRWRDIHCGSVGPMALPRSINTLTHSNRGPVHRSRRASPRPTTRFSPCYGG